MMIGLIPVDNGDVLAAVRGFLRRLLEVKVVEALYAPLESDGGAIVPALVADPARLERANPLAPVMPINGARAVSALTGKRTPARIGAVLRSCEIRALIELVKLKQATLENVTLIGIDCPGTFEVADLVEQGGWRADGLGDYLGAAKEGRDPSLGSRALRPACQMCTQPIPEHTDIHLHLFGVDTAQGIPVTVKDEIANQLQLPEVAETTTGGRS